MSEPRDPSTAAPPSLTPVPGRNCEGCTLCCKIFAIPEMPKQRHEWCRHCDIGKGCRIYDTRPETCRDFFCGYLLMPNLPEHWKPSRSRMVLTWESHANRMVINVDSGRPDAWRKEPYYAQIKKWAVAARQNRGELLLWQGRDAVVVLPDREVFVGALRAGQSIAILEKKGPGGIEYDVKVLEAANPPVSGEGSAGGPHVARTGRE